MVKQIFNLKLTAQEIEDIYISLIVNELRIKKEYPDNLKDYKERLNQLGNRVLELKIRGKK